MTRNELLMEKYEDALFAILMDQVAEEEGKLLLEENERLKENPEAGVSEMLDRRCHRTIKHAFSKEKRKVASRATYRVLSKVAIAATIGILLFTTAFAAFPEVRVKTLNLLIEVSDVATSLTFGDGSSGVSTRDNKNASSGSIQLLNGYSLPEVPEGFILNDEGSNSRSAWVEYSGEEDTSIYLCIESAQSSTLNVDTENAQSVESIQIHGYEGLMIEKSSSIHIVWGDTDQEKFIQIICNGLEKNIVLQIADEIKYVIN